MSPKKDPSQRKTRSHRNQTKDLTLKKRKGNRERKETKNTYLERKPKPTPPTQRPNEWKKRKEAIGLAIYRGSRGILGRRHRLLRCPKTWAMTSAGPARCGGFVRWKAMVGGVELSRKRVQPANYVTPGREASLRVPKKYR